MDRKSSKREPAPRGRGWVRGRKEISPGYMLVYKRRGKGQGTGLDLYFAPGDVRDRPLVLFHHIRKTAGTAIRHLLHANYGKECEFEVVPISAEIPVAEWHRAFWESLGDKRNRLVCAASHHGGSLFDLAGEREIEAFTLLRDPVDRALSNYYHFSSEPNWTLPQLYERTDTRRRANPAFALRRHLDFFNGGARSLLEPYYDTSALPLTADEPAADVWRERLFDVVETTYLVGAQDLFDQSAQTFAEAFGWREVFPAKARVNRDRMAADELPGEARELIRAFNWLDSELHARYLARLRANPDPAAAIAAYREGRAGRTVQRVEAEQAADYPGNALRLVQRAGHRPAAGEVAVRRAQVLAGLELARAVRELGRG